MDAQGVCVAGADGRIHRPGQPSVLGPVLCCAGFGEHRVAVHDTTVAVWQNDRQKRPFDTSRALVEVRIDRDGRLIAGLPEEDGVQVYEARTGKHLFDAGPDTAGTARMEVGGTVVACMLSRGGLRWYDLRNNAVFELPWVQSFALSGSGTWLAVTTPRGQVRVLDPTTGKDAIPAPNPVSEAPVVLMSFVNRKPDLLVLDAEGVLSVYDLAPSVTEDEPAQGRDLLDLNVDIDRLWGITGGRFVAIRFQDPDAGTSSVIFVDVSTSEVVSEVSDLLPYAWVDPETGSILQPVRGAAILEMDMYGKENRVLRALPGGEWVSIGTDGPTQHSDGFAP